MERKADALRQVTVLRHSVHVWVTKERGALYDRVQHARILQKSFSAWRHCMDAVDVVEGELA